MAEQQLDWTETLAALMDFQGYALMVQVSDRHEDRRHTPVLSAFGVLLGGVTDSGGMMALGLASRRKGNNGLLTLRHEDFEGGVRHGESHLLIKHAGLDVTIARGEKVDDDELGPEAGGGLFLGKVEGEHDDDQADDETES